MLAERAHAATRACRAVPMPRRYSRFTPRMAFQAPRHAPAAVARPAISSPRVATNAPSHSRSGSSKEGPIRGMVGSAWCLSGSNSAYREASPSERWGSVNSAKGRMWTPWARNSASTATLSGTGGEEEAAAEGAVDLLVAEPRQEGVHVQVVRANARPETPHPTLADRASCGVVQRLRHAIPAVVRVDEHTDPGASRVEVPEPQLTLPRSVPSRPQRGGRWGQPRGRARAQRRVVRKCGSWRPLWRRASLCAAAADGGSGEARAREGSPCQRGVQPRRLERIRERPRPRVPRLAQPGHLLEPEVALLDRHAEELSQPVEG
jgi:hypothetical protein